MDTPVGRQEAWPHPRGERGTWEMIRVLLYVSYTEKKKTEKILNRDESGK